MKKTVRKCIVCESVLTDKDKFISFNKDKDKLVGVLDNEPSDISVCNTCVRAILKQTSHLSVGGEVIRKTLNNNNQKETKEKVPDVKIYGNGDTFKLLCKASSKEESWMKSTKAMEIKGIGCVIQVTTQNHGYVEALTFVPGVKIVDIDGNPKNGRQIVPI